MKAEGNFRLFLFKMKDYKETKVKEKVFIREFDSSLIKEYVWHRDHEDRTIEIISAGAGWQLQFDNQLPFPLIAGDNLLIKKNSFHRLIKGDGNLIIRLTKH